MEQQGKLDVFPHDRSDHGDNLSQAALCMYVGPAYLVWETEGLWQFADLTQGAEILV